MKQSAAVRSRACGWSSSPEGLGAWIACHAGDHLQPPAHPPPPWICRFCRRQPANLHIHAPTVPPVCLTTFPVELTQDVLCRTQRFSFLRRFCIETIWLLRQGAAHTLLSRGFHFCWWAPRWSHLTTVKWQLRVEQDVGLSVTKIS